MGFNGFNPYQFNLDPEILKSIGESPPAPEQPIYRPSGIGFMNLPQGQGIPGLGKGEQGLESFSDQPLYPPSQGRQTAPPPSGGQEPSADIQPPPLWKQMLAGFVGGPQGLQMGSQRYYNREALPRMNMLNQQLTKARNAGDMESANQIVTQMANIAAVAPQFGPQVQQHAEKLSKAIDQGEQVDALARVAAAQAPGNSQLQQAVGGILVNKYRMSVDTAHKVIQDAYPQIVANREYNETFSKASGQSLGRKVQPVIADVKDIDPTTAQALDIHKIPHADYTDMLRRRNDPDAVMSNKERDHMDRVLQTVQGTAADIGSAKIVSPLQSGGPAIRNELISGQAPPPQAQQPQQMPQQQRPQGQIQQTPLQPRPQPQQLPTPSGQPAPPPLAGYQPGPSQPVPQPGAAQLPGGPNPNSQLVQRAKGLTNVPKGDAEGAIARAGPQRNQFGNVQDYLAAREAWVASVKAGGVTGAELAAKRAGSESAENIFYLKWNNAPGVNHPEIINKKGMSVSQLESTGAAQMSEPTKKSITDGVQAFNIGRDAFNYLKAVPESTMSSNTQLSETINKLGSEGLSVPFRLWGTVGGSLNIPGAGPVALTQAQQAVWEKLALVDQHFQNYISPGQPDSQAMQGMRRALLGAFSNKDTALGALQQYTLQAWSKMKGEMSIASGSGAREAQPPDLSFTAKGQGGLTESMTQENAKLKSIAEDYSLTNIGKTVLQDLYRLPQNIGYLAKNREVQQLRQQGMDAVRDAMKKGGEGAIDTVKSIWTSFQQRIQDIQQRIQEHQQNAPPATQQAPTVRKQLRAVPKGAINPDAVQSLKSIYE
jgi:hypothetical protein